MANDINYVYSAQVIQDPQDIGNYFPSGLCVGPNTNNDMSFPQGSPVSLDEALSFGYGSGMLIGPQCIYRINPVAAPIAPAPADIVTLPFSNLAPGQIITMQGTVNTPRATQILTNPSGKKTIQLDYPRTINLTLGVDGLTPATGSSLVLNFRGRDVWGRKVTTQASAIIPDGQPAGAISVDTPSALFQLEEIQVVSLVIGTVGANPSFWINSGSNFGLPYKLTDIGHVQNYSQWWANPTTVTAYPTLWSEMSNLVYPFGMTSTTITPWQVSAPAAVNPGVNQWNTIINASTPWDLDATTGDVRGTFQPNTILSYDAAGALAAGNQFAYQGPITITYYVPGADVFPWKYSQMMNQLQQGAVSAGRVAADGWNGFGRNLFGNYASDPNNTCVPNLDLLIGPTPYSDF